MPPSTGIGSRTRIFAVDSRAAAASPRGISNLTNRPGPQQVAGREGPCSHSRLTRSCSSLLCSAFFVSHSYPPQRTYTYARTYARTQYILYHAHALSNPVMPSPLLACPNSDPRASGETAVSSATLIVGLVFLFRAPAPARRVWSYTTSPLFSLLAMLLALLASPPPLSLQRSIPNDASFFPRLLFGELQCSYLTPWLLSINHLNQQCLSSRSWCLSKRASEQAYMKERENKGEFRRCSSLSGPHPKSPARSLLCFTM